MRSWKIPAILALTLCGNMALPAQEKGVTGATLRPETVAQGEVRLDGRITAVMSEQLYTLEVSSFTSPRGVTKDLESPRSKQVLALRNCWVHKRQPPQTRLPLAEVKLGSFVAVIGKDDLEKGQLLAREVILLDKAADKITAGNDVSVSQLVKLAREASSTGQAPRAQALYAQALGAAQGSRNRVSEAFVLRDIAASQADLGADQKAVETYTQAIAIAQAAGDARGQATALHSQSLVLERLGKKEAATQALARAEKLASESDPRLWATILYLQLAAARQGGLEAEQEKLLRRLIPLEEKAADVPQVVEHRLSLATLVMPRDKAQGEQLLAESQRALDSMPAGGKRAGLMARSATLLWNSGRKPEATRLWELAAKMAEAAGEVQRAAQIRGVSRLERAAEEALKRPAGTPADSPSPAPSPAPPAPVAPAAPALVPSLN